jgi:hypothetical protein
MAVAAFMTTMNFLASAETSAAASAFGVSAKPAKDIDVVARHQFLRQPLGHRRVDAAGVLADDLDILAAELVAVLLEIELEAVCPSASPCRRTAPNTAGSGRS